MPGGVRYSKVEYPLDDRTVSCIIVPCVGRPLHIWRPSSIKNYLEGREVPMDGHHD